MKRAVLTFLLVLCVGMIVPGFVSKAQGGSLKDFILSLGEGETKKPPQTIDEQRSIQPIPFAKEDDDPIHGQLHARHVFGQYYAAIEVQMGGQDFFPKDCDRNAGWKFLRFLGADRNGTFSVLAKFTVGSVSTELVPLFLVSKSGNSCEVFVNAEFAGRGVQVTPFFRLDAARKIDARFEVRYSDTLTFNIAKKWFDVFYAATTGFVSIGAIGVDQAGITLKQTAVLSGEEHQQIESAMNGVDQQLTNIFGPIVGSDRKLILNIQMPVEGARGAWLRTGLGPAVDTVAGAKAANIALVMRPRISLLVDNKSVKQATIGGAQHLVPDFSSLGATPRTAEIFYLAQTKSLASFDRLSESDEALKEKLTRLPAGADLDAWRSACGNVYRYLQSHYGLNDYDALAITASLFRANTALDQAFDFAQAGCSADTLIGDFWPPTNSPEVKATAGPSQCWNDLAKRATVRERLDTTLVTGLARVFKSDQADRRNALLTQFLTPGAALDDPHAVLPAPGNGATIPARLSNWAGEGGFCFDTPQELDAPVYQRGFLTKNGSEVNEVLFEFDDLCGKALNAQTPQINRVTLLQLSDDDDDLTLKTVERLINANKECTSCMRKLKAALPGSLGRFTTAPACP